MKKLGCMSVSPFMQSVEHFRNKFQVVRYAMKVVSANHCLLNEKESLLSGKYVKSVSGLNSCSCAVKDKMSGLDCCCVVVKNKMSGLDCVVKNKVSGLDCVVKNKMSGLGLSRTPAALKIYLLIPA